MKEQPAPIESYPLRRYLLLRARGKEREYFPFIYSVQLTITALNVDVVGTVQIDTDAPWLWLHSQGQAFDTAAGNTRARLNGTVHTRIGGPGGRSISRAPVAICNMYPFRGGMHDLPAAYPVDAGSMIHCTVRLLTLEGGVALPYDLRLNHIGVKVYGYGNGNGNGNGDRRRTEAAG